MSERAKPKTLRCAIYTRKSSEEGLEQDFNSLQAQREACEAYITSQRHEGWIPIKTAYDDGGYSGGTLERPALQKLLEDIKAKKIDVVVVYKVDRLTRALSDFAKIVEVFDVQGVSFVSVTQQFNTTSSMGRLTLNVLLSFAQFEREVTGERIRDKIAASKKKGLWMGGFPPLGYAAKERTLVPVPAEAKIVRTIFGLYLEHRSVRKVAEELDRLKLRTKRHRSKIDRLSGGRPFSRGHIYRILSNPLYLGEISHKGERHAGQHPGIVGRDVWDAAQVMLAANGHEHATRSQAAASSLLAGLLFDEIGNRFAATHTVKNGKRYRYYVAASIDPTTSGNGRARFRIAASEIEAVVIKQLVGFLTDAKRLLKALKLNRARPRDLKTALAAATKLAREIERSSKPQRRAIISEVLDRTVVGKTRVVSALKLSSLLALTSEDFPARVPRLSSSEVVKIETPFAIARRGAETLFVVADQAQGGGRRPDPTLVKAVARGHAWFEELASGRARSLRELAKTDKTDMRYIARLLPFAFLVPTVVDSILEGRQPAGLSVEPLMRQDAQPIGWDRQLRWLGSLQYSPANALCRRVNARWDP